MDRKFKIICQRCGEEAIVDYYSPIGLIANSNIETKMENKGGRIKITFVCTKCGNSVYFENA